MFLERFFPGAKTMFVPTPTYGNHNPIIKDSGLDIKKYRYYDAATGGLDFEGMKEDIKVSQTDRTAGELVRRTELTVHGCPRPRPATLSSCCTLARTTLLVSILTRSSGRSCPRSSP